MTIHDHRAAPVASRERILTPDLVRGAMLLFIALANAGNVAFAGQPGLEPDPHSLPGRILNICMVLFVDSRAYPVFAVMFGYGLVQLAAHCTVRGVAPRRILLRRNAWLVVFGAVHAVLLYFGDFLGAYGIVGLVATVLLLPRSERFHRLVLVVWAIQTAYLVLTASSATGLHGGDATLVNSPNPSLAATTYVGSLVHRLQEWPVHTLTVLPFIVVVWLGMWAAKRQILEHPERHRRLLVSTATVALTITFLGALPYALVAGGLVHLDQGSVELVARLHAVSGEYGGPGYVALFALVATRLTRRARSAGRPQNPVVKAVAALGRNSLSGYLFQSVAWMLLLSPLAWQLTRYGDRALVAAAVAVAVWATTVFVAWCLDSAGRRGPAEVALRRLVYGRR
ncbi:DUF418 domain-containing protein [Tsukamurella sp. 8F]|uniref:DUF418 domain-containing protein n=1 Tax=unclassified Tsukamurella TaxID=2633480 RepID=UPI0023B92E7D|nr:MULTISPECIES: DUF418 domain-containing protein [unclassified Tsukamurella]MDF0528809.1 DUF418 domain-containing protein [Tsukamurella sp. 8J]MDF0586644.1 DUF418 domain-containing protein [Tsukamurella sp. 8F]